MARSKRPPSHYPVIPNMIIRFVLGFSAVAVATIMCYFIYHLRRGGNYHVPGTFTTLAIAGFLTEAFLIGTAFLSCCFNISPIIYMLAHTLFLVLWTVGGILLGVYAGHTLTNACDFKNWGKEGEGGRHVCRIYKALFAFTFLAWFSTLCALYLDLHVRRKQTRHGAYSKMRDIDNKYQAPQDDPWSTELSTGPAQHSRGSYGRISEPRGGYGPVGETHAPPAERQPLNASGAPHQHSDAPPDYDTTYHGHSGELFYDSGHTSHGGGKI